MGLAVNGEPSSEPAPSAERDTTMLGAVAVTVAEAALAPAVVLAGSSITRSAPLVLAARMLLTRVTLATLAKAES